jgi:hypothetical protein
MVLAAIDCEPSGTGLRSTFVSTPRSSLALQTDGTWIAGHLVLLSAHTDTSRRFDQSTSLIVSVGGAVTNFQKIETTLSVSRSSSLPCR